jgi:hypothetical protein
MTTILTPQQIAQYAYNAGFRGAALNQAVAIALAESGGRIDAYNPELAAGTKTGSGSRGLWQIYGTAHPEFNNSGAFDPQVNANAAFKVFREAGNSFRPWSTFNQGLAAPRVDYASMIKGKSQPAKTFKTTRVVSSPVATVARGSTAPMTAQPASQPAQQTESRILPNLTPTFTKFLGIDDSEPNAKTTQDIFFIVAGFILFVLGLYYLFVIGLGKFAWDNKETVVDLAKVAAL